MRLPRRALLGLFVLASSCSTSPDGSPDTSRVAAETPAAASTTAPAEEIPMAEDLIPSFIGFAGTRFAIFSSPESSVVFDTATRRSFALPEPIRGGVTASDDGSRVLLTTERGLRLADLEADGATIVDWSGDATGAILAPDGLGFAATSAETITFVRATDGAIAAFPFHGSESFRLGWTSAVVHFSDDDGVHVVDRASWAEHRAVGAEVTMIDDGRTFAVSRDSSPGVAGFVDIWQFGEARPRWHVASAFVRALIAGDGRVAWTEAPPDAPSSGASIHTLDVAGGIHVRFAAKGISCGIDIESLVSLEKGELITNDECTPGCPSLWLRPSFVAYDPATGAVRRRWNGTPVPPEDYESVAERDRSLAIEGPSFDSNDGRFVAATAADGRPGVWETQSGRRLWSGR